jgi:hypothetical protein
MSEILRKLTNKELLEEFVRACEYVEFWSENGTYKDGKYEEAKAHRKAVKRLILERMERV